MNRDSVGIVVTGGRIPSRDTFRRFLDPPYLVVAADSGVDNAARLGLSPDFALGDFDSIENTDLLSALPPDRVFRYPREKDLTDTELALAFLDENDIITRVVVGGGGGRIDHLLALTSLFHRRSAPSLWITHNAVLSRLDGEHTFDLGEGRLVSFFPLGGGPCTMKSSGLRWPLDNLTWYPGDVGLSNETTAPTVSISVHSGALLMVQPLEDGEQ
ncbi:MAG: thiamine diphosphokinase [Spirochaetota bacterium]